MTVAEFVGARLAGLGVTHAFGVVGSGNFAVTTALIERGVTYVAARHEGGAATMADAFARTSGRVGVLSVHQGCGLTNALTGLTEAAKSRTPLIVLAAETAPSATASNFRVDQPALATAIGAVAERVSSPETAAADVDRAFDRAVRDRRTVVLNLPLDVQAAPAPDRPVRPVPPARYTATRPALDAAAALVRRLRAARRPVFIAGRGAWDPAAGQALAALAERTGALLATSAVARGLFRGSPWSIDVSGGFSTPLTAELVAGADLVVGWGCALNMWTTRHGRLIDEHAAVVQVDLDPTALGACRPVDLGVVGDVRATAEDVLGLLAAEDEKLGERAEPGARTGPAERAGPAGTAEPGEPANPAARPGYRSEELAARIAVGTRWRNVPYEDTTGGGRIDPRTLTIGLDDLLPEERVIGVDSGNFLGYPSMFLETPDERGLCFTQAFQSVGLGLATAIGAALASPGRRPVAALGDGGALMGISELETAVRLRLPLLVVVYNDAMYGAEVHHFTPEGPAPACVAFEDTDFAAIGRGFGCEGVTVREPADLSAVAAWLAGTSDRPLVVDAKVTRSGPSWWLAEAFGH